MTAHPPLVTVVMLAYNHGSYIERSIESVLNQKTTFPFLLVIGEDGSTDNTLAIARKYEDLYPNKVKVVVQDQSKKIYVCERPTGRYNFLSIMKTIRSKYIGLIDGDDYWIDDLKLQKQVDVMEEHPECTVCAANCYYDSPDSGRLYNTKPRLEIEHKKLVYEKDIVSEIVPYHPSSLLYRTAAMEYPDWYETILGVDFAIFIQLIQKGPFIAISDVCSVYRRNDGSVTKSRKGLETIVQQEYVKMYRKFDELTGYRHHKKFKSFAWNAYLRMAYLYLPVNRKMARKTLWILVRQRILSLFANRAVLSLFIRLYFPFLLQSRKDAAIDR